MSNKTEGVKNLVQDVLASIPEPYGKDITLQVCIAIENSRDWIRRYNELGDDLSYWVVNNAIGYYVKGETGLKSLGKKLVNGKCDLIKSYTLLGK